MDRLHGILVFLRVVEHGSLSGAARALGVSTAAVSSTLNRLELQLSARLLIRTTRKINTTPEGAEFYARCKRITADLAEAEVVASRAGRVVTGRLRVRLPLILGHMWIVPQLPRFMQAHPGLAVEVVCMDFVPYTIDEGLDLSVQTGELRNSSLAVRPLAETRYVVCGAPSYFSEHGKPQTLRDLGSHTCVAYRRPRNGRVREWRFNTGTRVRQHTTNSPLIFNRIELVVEAAKAGCGLIQVPECYVQPYIARGELVEALENHKTGGYHISVVYRQQQRLAAKLRVFMDFLVDLFEPPPWTRAPSGSPKATAPRLGGRTRQR
ncbi:MAG: LysR family transcriptional regulator [Betaproteobacteria bacterium]|nr:LysR family transcriptional regulator [Betaproteobacteria bacterium]